MEKMLNGPFKKEEAIEKIKSFVVSFKTKFFIIKRVKGIWQDENKVLITFCLRKKPKQIKRVTLLISENQINIQSPESLVCSFFEIELNNLLNL